jgi:hypothetical protein
MNKIIVICDEEHDIDPSSCAFCRIKKLENIGANLAGCLWDFYEVCPECGNKKGAHMPSCSQVYEKEFKTPADCQRVFDKAFKTDA